MDDKVTCMICNKQFNLISPAHLRSHSITVEEYKIKYPDSPLISESSLLKKRCSISKVKSGKPAPNKGIPLSDEHKKKLSDLAKLRPPTRTGAILSDETKRKISESLKGTVASDETRQKLKDAIQKRKDNGTFVAPVPKGTKLSPEHKEKSIKGLIISNRIKSEKSRQQKELTIKENNLTLLNSDDYRVFLLCNICETEFDCRWRKFNTVQKGERACPTCFPRDRAVSNEELEVLEYIKSIYSGTVIGSDREQLSGKEIDIFLPELNLGFEYCGLYWHSLKNSLLHKHHIYNKTVFARKLGIELITIFSDEWNNKKDIVKSRICNKLGLNSNSIYARMCEIRHIDNDTKNEFLETYHVQGTDISKIRYGAYYKDELVSVMTFAPTNMVKGGNGEKFELLRFCSKSGTNVVGIVGKFLKVFFEEFGKVDLISYSDNRYGQGGVYYNNGFKNCGHTPPSYYYTSTYNERFHRSKFMKHKLVNFEKYDEKLSEQEIMMNSGFDIIYDAGTTRWEYQHKSK